MAGHSKWANIKHRKAAADAKKGKVFTRLIKEITVAAKLGGGDPDTNPRLRLAMDKAREANMTKDSVQNAIKRGSGQLDGVSYEEVRYEGYGTGGAAVMVDCLTDNRTRTVAEVRHAFTKNGGNVGSDGSVAFLFKHCGQFLFAPGTSEDKVMEAAIDAGAEDVVRNEDGSVEVICAPARVRRGQGSAGEGRPEARACRDHHEAHRRGCARRRRRRAHAPAARRAGKPRRRAERLHHRGGRLKILGIDPGLQVTGFGVIEIQQQQASAMWRAAASNPAPATSPRGSKPSSRA